jgi:hypothetical protein
LTVLLPAVAEEEGVLGDLLEGEEDEEGEGGEEGAAEAGSDQG